MLPSGDQLVARLSGGSASPAPSSFPFSLQPGGAAGGSQAEARADDAWAEWNSQSFAGQRLMENWIQSGGPQRVMGESCIFKGSTAYIVGGGLGVAMGAFLAPFDSMNGLKVAENATAKEVAVATIHQTRTKAVSMGRTFAALGGIYAVTECVIEKYRAKTDLNNAMYAGCLTGGALARSAGPMGMAYGCGGFALWSVAMEKFMHSDMMANSSLGGGGGD
jgi:import inner membrane translocase subunit TIM22